MSTSPGWGTLSDRAPCQDPPWEGSPISTGGKKQRPGQKSGGHQGRAADRRIEAQDQSRLEEEAELDQQRANSLQSGVGNQGLLALMNKGAAEQAPSTGVEIEIEEEGAEFEADQEVEEVETQEATIIDTSGVPDLPDDDAPMWGNKELGGDDEPPKPPKKRRRPRRRRRLPEPLPDDPIDPSSEDPGADVSEELQLAQRAAPLQRPSELLGDEVHDALWGWLQDPAQAAKAELEPEDLIGLDPVHPLARCGTAGALLAAASPSVSGRALGQLTRPLPGTPGLSGQVARAAALATLGQAITARQTGVQAANRAISLVLEDDALPRARRVAWELARQGRMWAPAIFEGCIRPARPEPLDDGGLGAGPAGAALLTTALGLVAGPWGSQEVPPCPRIRDPAGGDPELAWLDAILAGGGPETDPRVLDYAELAAVIQGVRGAVRAAARLQVELAAAATSAWRVAGDGVRLQLRGVLRALWRELGIVARGALATTQTLEKQVGRPHSELGATFDQADGELGSLTRRLTHLRQDGLAALASVLAQGTRPVESRELP